MQCGRLAAVIPVAAMPRVSLVGGGKGGARVEGEGKDPGDSDNTWWVKTHVTVITPGPWRQ